MVICIKIAVASSSSFSHYTLSAFNFHKQVDVICTNFTKAFDKIYYKILLVKLSGFEFSCLLSS